MEWIGILISGIVTALASLGGTLATNRTNKQLAANANQLSQQEAEKSFYRSLPETQVRNLQNAGMSRAAALATLDNGGAYQAAPVSTAQMEAPDLSALNFGADLASSFQQHESNVNEKARVESEVKINEDRNRREQEAHDAEMVDKKYGHETRAQRDALVVAFDNKVSDEDVMSIRTEQDLRNLMKDTDAWKNANSDARKQLFEDAQRRRAERLDELHYEIENQAKEAADKLNDAQLRKALAEASMSEEEARRYPAMAELQKRYLNGQINSLLQDYKYKKDDHEYQETLRATEKLILAAEKESAEAQARIDKADADYRDSKFGRVMNGVQQVVGAVAPVVGGATNVIQVASTAAAHRKKK